ncbi:MAG: hypothetical protein GXN91_03600, partial [Epsilonproteobacteria bacterium]|nr:hypothetical protein [Campylobacterota bacterium]
MRIVVIFLAAAPFMMSIFILYYSFYIIHPLKRELSSYHIEWFNRLANSRLEIRYYKKSYMVIKATKASLSSNRFRLLRESFILRGFKPSKINSEVVVLLHGKNGIKEDLLPLAERFVAMGFIVVVPDLPLHGNSVYGVGEYRFLEKILDDAKKHIKLDKEIAIWGFSLGGAYALFNFGSSKYRYGALALISVFERGDKVVKNRI